MEPKIGRSRIPELLVFNQRKQVDLANYLGVSKSFITMVIQGRAQLSVTKMKATADFLGCHMDDLNEWIYDRYDGA